jgi:hypothetical protein
MRNRDKIRQFFDGLVERANEFIGPFDGSVPASPVGMPVAESTSEDVSSPRVLEPEGTAHFGPRAASSIEAARSEEEDRRRVFVAAQLRQHMDAYLRYEVGLLVIEHNLSPSEARKLLDGGEVRFAAPALVLFNDAWLWRKGELETIVLHEAAPLGLVIAPGATTIDGRVCDACRDWARAEARRRVDAHLRTTSTTRV